jgi:hypothetical protein
MIVLVVLKNETTIIGELEITGENSVTLLDALRLRIVKDTASSLEFTKYQPLTIGYDALFYNDDILHIHKDLQPDVEEYYKSYANKYFKRKYDVEDLFGEFKLGNKELH